MHDLRLDTPRAGALRAAALALTGAAVLAACGDAPRGDTPGSAAPPQSAAATIVHPVLPLAASLGVVTGVETMTRHALDVGTPPAQHEQIAAVDRVPAAAPTAASAPVVVGYRVHVRMDDGTQRTFHRRQVADLEVGSRVRVATDTVLV